MKNLVCPISDQRINEQVTRANAFLAIVTVTLAFLLNSIALMAFLTIDFYIRAFTTLKYSPVSFASYSLCSALNLPVKQTDKAPKIFAARLGFLMTALITVLYMVDFKMTSVAVASVLVFFASLEFFFAICVGCLIYTYLVLPFYKNN